jgi:hypothetical protein
MGRVTCLYVIAPSYLTARFPLFTPGARPDDGQHQYFYALLSRAGHKPPGGAYLLDLELLARYSASCLVVSLLSPPSPQRNRLDVEKWIEALDPLQAGSILSKEGMRTGTSGGSAMGGRRRSGSVLF